MTYFFNYYSSYRPKFTNLPCDGKLFIPENTTSVIDVHAVDNIGSESNGLLRYSIVGGVDANFFTIDEQTGLLQFKTAPDFENPQDNYLRDNIYDVIIQVKDGVAYTDQTSLWVMVTDQPENIKPQFTNLPDDGILMSTESNTFVINAESTDDSDSEGFGLKYSIVGGIDAESFQIDMTTGELSFKTPPDFENDQSQYATGDNVYDVTIRVEDSHGLYCDKLLWVKVQDDPETSNLGDKVFIDSNRNGVQDSGEDGVANVTVTVIGDGEDNIFGTIDDVVATVVTDETGKYSAIGLEADSYKVTFSNLPAGFEFTNANQGFDDSIDSDADPATGMSDIIHLGEGETNNTIDAGVVAPIKPASLGNKVFNDLNGNGIQERGEPGVTGITVTLTGGGNDGIIGTSDDTTESKTTGAKGTYAFTELTTGVEYKVTFSNLPDGFEFTTSNQGINEARDSDADPSTGMTGIVILEAGEMNSTVDAGLIFNEPTGKNFIKGTIAPDFLPGTAADDDIRGLGDSDTLLGYDGNDCLYGNGGFDLLRGGNGSDTILGGQENDTLFGEGGNDILSGGVGHDRLFGGGGRDTLNGTNGTGVNEQDVLQGGSGADTFILGDSKAQYYVTTGTNDFATLEDFNAAEDTIQIKGSVDDYNTQQNGVDLELRFKGALIAVFENISSLDLSSVARLV